MRRITSRFSTRLFFQASSSSASEARCQKHFKGLTLFAGWRRHECRRGTQEGGRHKEATRLSPYLNARPETTKTARSPESPPPSPPARTRAPDEIRSS